MKEPTESVADLLKGQNQGKLAPRGKSKAKSSNKAKKRKNDCDEDDKDDESVQRYRQRSRKKSGSATNRRSTKKVKASPASKSPVVKHSRARKLMEHDNEDDSDISANNSDDGFMLGEDSDDGDNNEGNSDGNSDVDQEEEEEKAELKIQRIVATRSYSRRTWKDICKGMETSEVENGSRWFQSGKGKEEDVDLDKETKKRLDDRFEDRFLVKWSDLSFLHCTWETREDLIDQIENAKNYLSTFFRKSVDGYLYDADDRLDGEFFDPAYVQIDRILEISPPESMLGRRKQKVDMNKKDWGIIFDKSHEDYDSELGRQFLIKWGNSQYTEATYEYERDLIMAEVEYLPHVEDFLARSKKVSKAIVKKNWQLEEEERRRLYKIFGDSIPDSEAKEKKINDYKKKLEEMKFKNGGQLRDYQAEGVSWLLANHINKRSAILADEMGLGKTIQTAAYVYMVNTLLCCRGPFLIVAPLSTIPHWQREFDGWTGMNTIVYHGSANDREVIREYEFAFECDRPQGGIGFNQRYLRKCHGRSASRAEKIWMAQVVITTPEMLVTDDFSELKEIKWEILVVDEAHRLKNHNSKLALNLRSDGFNFKHTVLLTGTPIQNNMSELWTLMNFINRKEFKDCDEFMEKYGDMRSKESVDGLHSVIRPYILRRLKEDVEKSVPPKEETLIEVELTFVQKQYYRALYEKNVQFLHKDVKKALDGPSLNNLAMQLRKCCNHPFLLNGVEEKIKEGKEHKTMNEEADFLVKSSGKLVLLDKLLPKLKQNGHRLLIFSQFKIMLDILEDYLALREFKFERIDGSITGKKRQMAIDRFQAKSSMETSFIMLLSTRAGGVGINLTAADTCIIFDSDWNPQNDLQAQARCHRIGQTKCVKVYRLLTRKTYEMQMFHMSSLKMGLDQAVLQGIENGGEGEQSLSKEEIEKLLRCGAYDIFSEEQAGSSEKESNDFIEQDIDSILARRTKIVVHENTGSMSNAAGGTFSKASFTAKGSSSTPGKDVDIDDPDFWTKMVGTPVVDEENVFKSGKKKRRRTATNYNERSFNKQLDEHLILNYGDSDSVDDFDGYSSSSSQGSESFNVDQACEFNLNSESPLQNDLLMELLNKKKEHIASLERKRWGGTQPNQWSQSHVEIVLNLLLKYGYSTGERWSMFLKQCTIECKKDYSEQEVKRMCWALCLLTLVETVIADVSDVAKRKQRAAEKKKEASPNDSTAPPQDNKDDDINVNSKEWKEKQTEISFKRFWEENKWIRDAVDDAVQYTKESRSRDPSLVLKREYENRMQNTPLLDAFVENVLPALKNRGWQEEEDGERRSWLSPTKKEFRFVDELLDQLPSIHSELTDTILTVIAGVAAEQKHETQPPCEANEFELNADDCNMASIQSLLNMYAPMQLITDRQRQKLISLRRKNLEILTFLRNARILWSRIESLPNASSFSTNEKCNKMSKMLNIHYKSAIPHPLWKPIHDAVLISAIAKHGWLENGQNSRDIKEDETIQWGKPFDGGDFSPKTNGKGAVRGAVDKDIPFSKDQIVKVAERAADFLNSAKDTKELKGFNLNLVLKSYGIAATVETDSNGQIETSWEVNEDLIDEFIQERNNNSVALKETVFEELPPRKDLVRRAKFILSNASETKASHKDVGRNDHEFTILDQGCVLNIFLAELLREVVKQPQKGLKLQRLALEFAVKEVYKRHDTIPEGKDREDFEKLKHNLEWIYHNRGKMARSVKNVLRAILALSLIPPVNSDDKMFPDEIKDWRLKEQVQQKSSSSKKSNESAVGDLAINKAISVAKQKVKSNQSDERNDLLGITTIETLILSVMCSQGIPIWSESWEYAVISNNEEEGPESDEFLISWFHMGNVLEVAAEKWVEISQMRLQKAERSGSDKTYLEQELESRLSAHEEAMRLHQKPVYLAKKTIMLIEALRSHMPDSKKAKATSKIESGLGTRVIQWSRNHLTKWARSLNICVDGQPMNATVMTIRPDSTANGYLDKKNCKAIFGQISQQTRLRSVFARYDKDEMSTMVSKAVKNMKRNGEIWLGQPSWWNSTADSSNDFELLSGVLQFGYGGFEQMVEEIECFSGSAQNRKLDDRLNRSSVQQRVNSITRELSAMDDSAETIRLMKERKSKIVEQIDSRPTSGNSTIQVGIDAFFRSSDVREKSSTDETTTSVIEVPVASPATFSDDSDIEVIAVVSPKRKSDAVHDEDSDLVKRSKIE